VLGVVMIGFGLWSLLRFLPAREAARDDAYAIAATAGSLALIVFGLFAAVAGAVYRAQIETICRRCDVPVIGWKRAFGLHCPLGAHYAKVSWFLVIVTSIFWVTALGVAGGLTWLVLS
jgi:hypothetical protein